MTAPPIRPTKVRFPEKRNVGLNWLGRHMHRGLHVTGWALQLKRRDTSTFHKIDHSMLKASRSWGDWFMYYEELSPRDCIPIQKLKGRH